MIIRLGFTAMLYAVAFGDFALSHSQSPGKMNQVLNEEEGEEKHKA